MARRDRPDHYANRARREGYRARSVYKLEEMQRKFGLLEPGVRVLDVGAAPGSWTQFALRAAGRAGVVVAVDLSPLDAIVSLPGVIAVTGDVFDQAVIDLIGRHAPYDVVLSDAAPSTTGNRTVDTGRSAALVEHVLWLAESMLRPGGNLAAKLFQGGDEQRLLAELRRRFVTARLFKPQASRSESFETFLVGMGHRPGSAPDADQYPRAGQ